MALGIVDKCNSQSVSLNDWVKLITTGMIISWNILQYLQSSLCLPILSLNTEAFSINLYFSACSFIAFHDSRQRLPLFDSSSIFKASGQFSLNLSKRIRLAASDKFLIAPWGKTAWSATTGPYISLLIKISRTQYLLSTTRNIPKELFLCEILWFQWKDHQVLDWEVVTPWQYSKHFRCTKMPHLLVFSAVIHLCSWSCRCE